MQQEMFSELRGWLLVLQRRKGLIGACVLAGLAVATCYNLLARPLYKASALVELDVQQPNLLPIPGIIVTSLSLETARGLQILNGQDLAERVVARMGPRLEEELRKGAVGGLLDRFQGELLSWLHVGSSETAPVPGSAVVASRVHAEAVPDSTFLRVWFTAYDPELAALGANTTAEAYVEHTLGSRVDSTTGARSWLEEQVDRQKRALGENARSLSDYEVSQGVASIGLKQRMLQEQVQSLSRALTDLRTALLTKQAALDEIKALPSERLFFAPQLLSDAGTQAARLRLEEAKRQRATLAQTLGEAHPELVEASRRASEAEQGYEQAARDLIQALEGELIALHTQEQTLLADLDRTQAEQREIDTLAVDYDVIKREAQADEAVLGRLIDRSKDAGLSVVMPLARITQRATAPNQPFSPQRLRNYRLGFIIGLVLGLVLTVLAEHLDDSVKTPDDIAAHVKVAFLGVVPEDAAQQAPRGGVSDAQARVALPDSPLGESYRLVRTNVLLAAAPTRQRVLILSSAHPGEGKSTTVANLGLSLAANGARVLAVDADLRRPTLHKIMKLDSSPGLTELIAGAADREAAIRCGVAEGLDLLPCGTLPPNPAELLGCPAARELFRALREDYDWVLIDAPPLLPVADATILCPWADGLVLVIAAGQTSCVAALRAAEQVAAAGTPILGAVLNRVDVARNAHYYGRYYGRYEKGYYGQPG